MSYGVKISLSNSRMSIFSLLWTNFLEIAVHCCHGKQFCVFANAKKKRFYHGNYNSCSAGSIDRAQISCGVGFFW